MSGGSVRRKVGLMSQTPQLARPTGCSSWRFRVVLSHRSRLARLALVATSCASIALVGVASAPANAAPDPNTDAPSSSASDVDAGSVIVQLSLDPLSINTDVDKTKGKVNTNGSKTKSTRAKLVAQRNALRQWMKTNAPDAKITGEYDFALNGVAVRLNGTSASVLKGGPGVINVVEQNVYHPAAADDPDLSLIKAQAAWASVGATSVASKPSTWAGYGEKVGIIDTGIDTTHPCFNDAGFPATKQLGDTKLTNNKVIVAKVFNNKLNQNGFDASAQQEHGSHVAGTVACDLNTPAVVNGVAIPYTPSGVAPGAQVGSYNIFPGNIENARTEDIFNAMQAAADDGMDVLNMSLGGGTKGAQDLGVVAVNNLDRAGIVVAVAAGNDGPGYGTVGSPGSAERALTAGAASVGQYVASPIMASGKQVSVGAAGDFPTPTSDLTAPLAVVTNADGSLSQACSALPAGSLTGKIALVSRGTCTFGNKVYDAQKAGAIAVIVVNNLPGDPISMAADAAFPTTIPAVMAPLSDKAALVALDGQSVTIGATKTYVRSGNDNLFAGFSSWGPTNTYLVKPDVVAPGVNILSSIPHQFCAGDAWVATKGCWTFMQGTSMATPHLAGMAAVVRAAHPSWDAWQVRSAIINTANQNGVLTADGSSVVTDVQKVGAGLANLDAAVKATLAFSQPSVSFGAIPAGSGQTRSTTITVTNLTSSAISAPVSVGEQNGVGSFSASVSSVTIPAGGSASITVTYTAVKGAATGATQAVLHVGSEHAALYAMIK